MKHGAQKAVWVSSTAVIPKIALPGERLNTQTETHVSVVLGDLLLGSITYGKENAARLGAGSLPDSRLHLSFPLSLSECVSACVCLPPSLSPHCAFFPSLYDLILCCDTGKRPGGFPVVYLVSQSSKAAAAQLTGQQKKKSKRSGKEKESPKTETKTETKETKAEKPDLNSMFRDMQIAWIASLNNEQKREAWEKYGQVLLAASPTHLPLLFLQY